MNEPALVVSRWAEGPDEAWNAFVGSRSEAEVAHTRAFLDVLRKTFRLEVVALVARRGERWVGVLPLVAQRSLVGRFLTSVPYLNYGGVLGDDPEARRALADEAVAQARAMRADRLELRGRAGGDLPLPVWPGKARYGLALDGGPEALWDALGSKVRAQVKRPGKEGYRSRVTGPEARTAFYELLARRWHELGSPIVQESFFEAVADAFPGDVTYVLVEKDGACAAAGLLLRSARGVEIPWAASAREHDRFGVNMLLYWASIEHAASTGASVFDFGRSTPGTGNARFKLQWGAVEEPLLWNAWSEGARGRSVERGDTKRGLAAAAWSRIPAFVAGRLGPFLAARIPY